MITIADSRTTTLRVTIKTTTECISLIMMSITTEAIPWDLITLIIINRTTHTMQQSIIKTIMEFIHTMNTMERATTQPCSTISTEHSLRF